MNSETDFVARNTHFQSLATRIGQAALASLPAPAAGQEGQTGGAAAALAALTAAPLPGGDSVGKPCGVGAGVTDMVAKIGENIVLRRGATLGAPRGMVAAYTHNALCPGAGTIGVLVALVPKDAGVTLSPAHAAWPALAEVGKRVAMHIAAAKPAFLGREGVPAAAIERERDVLRAQAEASGKSAANAARMVEGRLSKFYAEACLLEQPFVLSEEGVKVGKMVDAAAAAAGVPVRVAAFTHFVVGEEAAKEAAVAAATTGGAAA